MSSAIDRRDRGVRIARRRGAARVLVVLVALPALLSLYWIDVLTAVAIYSIVALGLGLLMGRVGLVSLGQIAVLALGAWVAARTRLRDDLPFPLVLLLAGLITMVLGTLVGLPALRLSGLYLALITLMLAGAITVVLTDDELPQRRPRASSATPESSTGSTAIRRPAIAESDPAYFRYSVIVAALMFLLALWHIRAQAGPRLGGDPPERAGRARRGREHHALQALGVRAGVVHDRRRRRPAGRRASASSTRYQFPTRDSIILLAVVLMGGIYSLWGAVVAGVLHEAPAGAARQTGACRADLLTILFGVGVLQVLLTAPAGLADAVAQGPGAPAGG